MFFVVLTFFIFFFFEGGVWVDREMERIREELGTAEHSQKYFFGVLFIY